MSGIDNPQSSGDVDHDTLVNVTEDQHHARAHDVNSASDHAASAVGDRGKFVKANSTTGAIEFSGIADADIPAAIARDSEITAAVSTHEAASDPHTGYQKESEKAQANGYASLDGAGTIPDAQIPSTIARDSELPTQYTDEMAQDAVGGMIADTQTLNLTYTDSTPELKGDVVTQMSITADASGLKLSGDAVSPGNSKYYGTDSGGTKGFHSLPAGGEAFPIGSVFIAVVNTNPGTLLGYGTWSAFGAGRVLVGLDSGDTDFDTAEETGGAKTVTLTEAQIPAHRHALTNLRGATTGGATTGFGGIVAGNDTSSTQTAYDMALTGGGGAHSNVQPYIVVYMWKRTA